MIEIKRGKNRNYLILKDGKYVGSAWKYIKGPGFGVNLQGIYWSTQHGPNTRGGMSCTSVKRLKDVAPLAEETITKLGKINTPFMFEVGKEYETQAGDMVKVIGRSGLHLRGYETMECSDGRYRYDRSTPSSDAGRCTGTDHDYSCPNNFKREFPEAAPEAEPKTFEFTVILRGTGVTEDEAWDDAVEAFTDDPGAAESSIEINEDGDPI